MQIQTSIENTLLDLLCGAEAVVRASHLRTDPGVSLSGSLKLRVGRGLATGGNARNVPQYAARRSSR